MRRFEDRINEMNAQESELVLTKDGAVYHLGLKPHQVAKNVIVVGDPARVRLISSHFEHIEHQVENREFATHTGIYKGVRITAMSTGIGTDNIDIVMNELDAVVNYDLETRTPKPETTSLNIIRIGTCGALWPELEPDSTVITSFSIGLDGVRHFYEIDPSETEAALEEAFISGMSLPKSFNRPYASEANEYMLEQFGHLGQQGITIAANGFFGPQGRQLRIPLRHPSFNKDVERIEFKGQRILNYEMESSALYALGHKLGHKCLCVCVVVANRKAMKFSTDYHTPMSQLIVNVLDTFAKS